jgi:hypothetical protein
MTTFVLTDELASYVSAVNRCYVANERLHLENAVQDLADALGFDLVKRQTAQQAHEAMLAKRVAETPDWETTR